MDLRDYGALALVLVIGAFVIAVGAEMLDELQDQQTANTVAYNVTTSGLEGMETFGDWIPLIALVVVLSLIIGILIKQLGGSIGA